jgi:tetratricopeptide (TPR) repeat protein
LIEKIVGFAEILTPIALIGVGGIGKTSIALTVLHNDRIKQQFGHNRRFIRCDQFPSSLPHFLHRLSEVIGAGIKNPESLTLLYPFLSSGAMLIVLDNAESILDPKGEYSQEIYDVVEELSHFSNISLCITSRISTIPPDFKTIEIPTLWMEPARETFYRIYQYGEPSGLVDVILEQLEFHPLSITLLATVAHQNKWGADRLSEEWKKHRTGVLKTQHNKSLAAAIELSLASPMFQELGPDARGLLGVIAFFPQGVDENNLDWLFHTIFPDGKEFFDKFCALSLTNRSDGFTTMLAPLRDYLCPKKPMSSPLLCVARNSYFVRMSVDLDNPNVPGFEDARWITSEDVNVEHLLDVFASVDASSDDVWKACADFFRHIFWFKKRPTVLSSKVEGLPDDHHSKPECLLELSQIFRSLGNHAMNKELLAHALRIWREREDRYRTAQSLMFLAYTNEALALYQEGILQAKEASEICEQFDVTDLKAHSFRCLAWLLRDDNQLDAAEVAASRAIDAFKDRDDQYGVCSGYRTLAMICRRKGKIEVAISHLEAALELASASSWERELFWSYYCLAEVFFDEGRFDDAHTHVELAKSHSAGDRFNLGRGTQLQAEFFYKQRRLEEARSEVEKAIEIFEKTGATVVLGKCEKLLQDIQNGLNESVAAHGSGGDVW